MTTTPVTPPDRIVTQIRELEERRYTAMTEADVAALDALLADELSYTHSNATRDTKAEYVALVADGTFDYGPITHTEHDVIVFADTALVLGEMRCEAVIHGSPRSIHNVGLAVWVHREGDWRLAAYQPTAVPR
jgi:ketosteroid isomerase-like protein